MINYYRRSVKWIDWIKQRSNEIVKAPIEELYIPGLSNVWQIVKNTIIISLVEERRENRKSKETHLEDEMRVKPENYFIEKVASDKEKKDNWKTSNTI